MHELMLVLQLFCLFLALFGTMYLMKHLWDEAKAREGQRERCVLTIPEDIPWKTLNLQQQRERGLLVIQNVDSQEYLLVSHEGGLPPYFCRDGSTIVDLANPS